MLATRDFSYIDPEIQTGVIGIERGWFVARLNGAQIGDIYADSWQDAYREFTRLLDDLRQDDDNNEDWLTAGLPQTTGQWRQICEDVI